MGNLVSKVDEHLDGIDNGDILEIGMDRGENSTSHLINLAGKLGVKYVGVDVCKTQTKKYPEEETHNMTGEDYLTQVKDRKFSIVYLDNFDWNYWPKGHGIVDKQREQYKTEFALEYSNINSQIAHLLQSILLQNVLTDNATIICDDTWWDEHHMVYLGKCSSAVPYLISKGFTVAHTEGVANNPASCVVLTRRKNGA
jgi:hypothetical protein